MNSFDYLEDISFNLITNIKNETEHILSNVESSPSRVITIEDSFQELHNLTIKQEKLFIEGIKCIEYGLFRSAYVLCWSAFIDFLTDIYIKNNEPTKTSAEIRTEFNDYRLIEQLKSKNLIDKNLEKKLKDLLNSRNEYAHPSDLEPNLNESLGYISTILNRIKYLQSKIG